MSLLALVIEPDLSSLRLIVGALTASHFHVTVADNFKEAKTLLATRAPDVLITNLRLGEYNGLHLVLRGKAERSELGAIVLSDVVDAVLRADAERIGATFVLKPVNSRDLMAVVYRSVSRGARHQEPIRPPFERRSTDRRAGRLASAHVFAERRIAERRREWRADTYSVNR